MKTITSNLVTRVLVACFWILVFQGTAHAQTGSYLSWNNQVGCISYDSQGDPKDPRKEYVLLQDIENAPCIRVCENSIVNYVMNGATITNVQWSTAGGTLVSTGGAGNKNATVNWGAPGNAALNLTINYSNGTQSTITVCIEIINGPKAEFAILGNNEPVFCLDTPINFDNLSVNNGGTEIVQYFWDFGDGEFSYTYEPTHSYDQPGTYTIKLRVTNKCNCSSYYDLKVEIVDKPTVVIECPSVVCEKGEKETYTVNDCGGHWEVVGGHVVDQTPTSVTVVWDNVDDSGFGTVSYMSGCTCPFWTTVKIPVVKQVGKIEGNSILCLNEQGLYTLPQWPTTDFVWTLSPNTTGTHLVYVDQRNQIVVDALSPGSYDLVCKYTNTLLGCSGEARIKITVAGETLIVPIGTEPTCSGTVGTYTTAGGGSVQWQLKKGNAIVASTTGVNFSYPFPTGGVYTLTAAAGGCISQPRVINITQTPAVPVGPIVGETKYCPTVPYEYSLNNTVPNTVLEWSVAGGTIQGDNTGNNVTIVFGTSATATITVVRRSLDGSGCTSAPLNVTVSKIVITAAITSIPATSVFCPSSQATFSANLNGVTPDMVEWSVSPSTLGGVVSGVNSTTAVVAWNEISGTNTGTLILKVKKCGVDTYFNTPITIMPRPTTVFNAPQQICYGSPLVLDFTASGATTGTINWDFGNGNTASSIYNPLVTSYTVANPYNNTTSSNISYTIKASLSVPNGCNYVVDAYDTIIVFPRTTISVTPGYNYVICPTGTYSTTLSANAISGLGVTVSYQWIKVGTGAIGSGNTYTISNATQGTTPQGTYFVRVTDSNGCVTDSQNITVIADCNPLPPCTITPAPNLDVTAVWSACNTVTATATYNGTPASIVWQGSPFLTYLSGNNSATGQFSVTVPGAHLVTVKVTYNTPSGPCTVQKTVEIKTHYKPDFNTTVTCNGTNNGYNVTLLNNSTVFEASTATYTFSGTGMSPQTDQVINLTNLAPGTYTYTLTVSMPGKPSCSITKTVILNPLPVVNFTVSPSSYCAENAISLTIPSYNSVNTYQWFFNGTSYIASGPTTLININAGGTFPITLKATNAQGCSFTSNPVAVNISKPVFNGNMQITPGPSVCEGSSPAPVLSFAGTGTLPSTYAWMRGNIQVGTASTYSPTVSGNYWLKLFSAQGCQYVSPQSINVVIKQRPYAGIVGSTTVCAGDTATIQGVVTNNTVEHRWLLGGNPMAAPFGTWSTGNNSLVVTVPSAAGTYNYTFEVRPAGDVSCGSTASISVTVNPPVTPPVISIVSTQCEPYEVVVTASGPATGTYNWSNGMTGQTISVQNGGALNVTYTAVTGCKAVGNATIPQAPERLLWIFPTGCYDVCLTNPVPYILGPFGIFSHYEWIVNGNITSSGNNTVVPNQVVNQSGTYQLAVINNGCLSESGIMNVAPNLEKCDIRPCDIKVGIKKVGIKEPLYVLDGQIDNPTGSPITVTITSFNNYGTYSPNTVTIPAGGSYIFSPLYFTPNANFTGGEDYMVVQVQGRNCMSLVRVTFPKQKSLSTSASPAVLSVAPNPAEETTVVHYNLGDEFKQAESLIVFDLLGNEQIIHKLDKSSGDVELLLSGLASGTYIVSIQADGQRAIQQTLVKK
ncbi:PKD domain-containing protein [Flavobacterium sp. DG1-102-2]|uniref:PKD domain-containing protein n=1 Tax=Flavobacterium sp. DG1-102-2 TaxID=3081663 RepID=UPI0029497E8A|nr:PKD domain-containing protein [Flavobacterium sp. DG1-102-2]MDV6167363.1 PKD domain-containing protein [Flavobacterium sp. DG1-102-2]